MYHDLGLWDSEIRIFSENILGEEYYVIYRLLRLKGGTDTRFWGERGREVGGREVLPEHRGAGGPREGTPPAMPVFVPVRFEERRQGRRRCNLKGRSTDAAL